MSREIFINARHNDLWVEDGGVMLYDHRSVSEYSPFTGGDDFRLRIDPVTGVILNWKQLCQDVRETVKDTLACEELSPSEEDTVKSIIQYFPLDC